MPATAPPPVPPSSQTVTPVDGRSAAGERGFTLIEVLVAAMILIVALMALLGMIAAASHATQTNRVRQATTNLAREVIENVRSLAYTQLATPASIAAALQPQLAPGATLSGATLVVTRGANSSGTNYTFNVAFTSCSLDDPSDGYGSHSALPASGGTWCTDVAPNGAADSNPDDYKRISVTVTPVGSGGHTSPVQQTVAIYARPVNGPAVSCLTMNGTCPGTNQSITAPTQTTQTFTVTTTSLAYEIQWLVNGNPPGSQDATGANGTYTPSGTTSTFTWTLPPADGIYSISAVALDPNGNSGTRVTLQIAVNRHPVIPPGAGSWGATPAPGAFNSGYDQQINNGAGGVDIQWTPSIDQDVKYYNVYHQIGNATPTYACTQVTGTSCTDTSALTLAAAPSWPSAVSCNNPPQSGNTTDVYWVVGVDNDPNGVVREGAASQKIDANACDHAPSAPTGLNGTLSNGALNLSWTAPSAPVDPDAAANNDTISAWRLYRWSPSQGSTPQLTLANRLQVIGAGNGQPFVTTATDPAPDPGGAQQDYCVTAVDTHLDESPCLSIWQQ